MSRAYYNGSYPQNHFSIQPYPLEDERVVAHIYYRDLQYVLYMNPTDKRGYRCIVRFIDNAAMKHTVNRYYTPQERNGLWRVVSLAEAALHGLGATVQVAKAGNNAHIFDAQSKITQFGHAREADMLHAHLWVRGDPESEPVPGIPLDGPVPGEIFDMRGQTSGVPGNECKKPWKEGDMQKVALHIRKCLFDVWSLPEFDDLKDHVLLLPHHST